MATSAYAGKLFLLLYYIKRIILPGDEGTPAGHHNVLLAVNVLLLECIDNVLFLEALESKSQGSIVGALDEFDASESTDAQRGNNIQIGESHLSVFGDELRRYSAISWTAAN